jgi:hypothetical protein
MSQPYVAEAPAGAAGPVAPGSAKPAPAEEAHGGAAARPAARHQEEGTS